MNFKNFALIISVFLVCHTTPAFSQTKGINTYTLELFPQEASGLKVYRVKESDLKKIRIPKNYMMVKKPSDETIFLWEIPERIPESEHPEKKEEKKDTIKTATTTSSPDRINLFELSKQLGVGEIKSGAAQEAVKQLLELKKN